MRNLTPEEIKEMMNSGKFSWDITVKQKYIEPERDEQGTLYGYKVLQWDNRHERFVSPVRPAIWNVDGFITSDAIPNEHNTNGIYSVKDVNNFELRQIIAWGRMGIYSYSGNCFIVKLALSGVVIEGELGFRSEHAQIISILDSGHWLTYEEFTDGNRKNNQNPYRHSKSDSNEESKPDWWNEKREKGYYSNTWNSRTKLADEDSTEG
jgi:hypothetical protein